MKRLFFLLLLSILTLSGCGILFGWRNHGQYTSGNQETPNPDPVVPPNYKQIFVKNSKTFSGFKDSANIMDFSSIQIFNNKVRLYFNIYDSLGNYYKGGSDSRYKKYFCLLEETVNGKTYKITDFTIKEETFEDKIPVAIAVVMDHSGSMGNERAYQVQDAAISLINRKKPEDAIAIVKYDNRVVTEVPLTNNRDILMNKFKRNGLNEFGYTTAILNGIGEGIQQLKHASDYQYKIVVVFTDGQDNSSTKSFTEIVNAAKEEKINIIAVDFGDRINEGYMKAIADSASGKYYHIYYAAEFELLFNDIYNRIKNRYYVEYTPRAFGKRQLKFDICHPKGTKRLEKEFEYLPNVGSTINLNILFATDKAEIRKEYKEDIDAVVQTMKMYPTIKIELAGHTDSQGPDDHNLKLSQARADAVMKALVNQGIEKDRIVAKGYGETKPIAPNDTEEGRAKNRRTELIIISR